MSATFGTPPATRETSDMDIRWVFIYSSGEAADT